jgi:hypothetical protein
MTINVLSHLVAEHPQPALSAALTAIARGDDWIDADVVRWGNPQHVLATAWNAGRLARARLLLANGEAAPPIVVIGYRLGSDPALYSPEDGIHRTMAAREAGRKVKARIKGYYHLAPRAFVLANGRMLPGAGDKWWLLKPQAGGWQGVSEIDASVRPILKVLGGIEVKQRGGVASTGWPGLSCCGTRVS